MNYLEKVQLELSELTGSENDSENLENSVKVAQVQLIEASKKLNEARHKIAKEVEKILNTNFLSFIWKKLISKLVLKGQSFRQTGMSMLNFYSNQSGRRI